MDPYSAKQESEFPYINLVHSDPRYGQLYKVVPIAGGKEEHIYMNNPSDHSIVVESKNDNRLATTFFANGGSLSEANEVTPSPAQSQPSTQPSADANHNGITPTSDKLPGS